MMCSDEAVVEHVYVWEGGVKRGKGACCGQISITWKKWVMRAIGEKGEVWVRCEGHNESKGRT